MKTRASAVTGAAPISAASRGPSRTYLAGTVYEALRRDILERKFVPGEPLTEQELSRRYGVSRTPVREALAKLERDRLLRGAPKKGGLLRAPSPPHARGAYSIPPAPPALPPPPPPP